MISLEAVFTSFATSAEYEPVGMVPDLSVEGHSIVMTGRVLCGVCTGACAVVAGLVHNVGRSTEGSNDVLNPWWLDTSDQTEASWVLRQFVVVSSVLG